ncbi:Rpn family recombination-promoting nuclease/putative transposase [Sulfurihydrogenibium sp.]|uniref:Rpn family recombination-promoting nuclease/putative transposase n=1 Tax=Sulfurihydrogenibium sp. TaxID=2053621 RepID=UPI002624C6E5|nr:Rpn family recombination-promoting nuclease/putative transposase [Sulfurihydrogenibium sp.]
MENKESIQPHDWFFKQVFSNPKNVQDFISIFLPDLSQKIQLNSLEIVPSEKFSNNQKKHFLDLLYKCKLNDKDAYIRLIFEHKSYVDKKLPLQLMQYNAVIWEEALKEKDYYPPIINIVFYHGRVKWNFPTTIPEIEDEELDKYIQKLNYILIDLNEIEDENLKRHLKKNVDLIMEMLIMKHIHDRLERIKTLLKDVKVECSEDCFVIILNYLVLVKKDYEKVEEVLREIRGGEEKMMLFTDKLKIEGKIENLRENIIDLIDVKFGVVDKSIVEKVNQIDNIETLKQILRIVGKSHSLDEVREKLNSL